MRNLLVNALIALKFSGGALKRRELVQCGVFVALLSDLAQVVEFLNAHVANERLRIQFVSDCVGLQTWVDFRLVKLPHDFTVGLLLNHVLSYFLFNLTLKLGG